MNIVFFVNMLILMNMFILMKLGISVNIAKLVILVQSVTNIFEYSNIQIFLIRIFIQIFVRIIFWIRIYSDIRLCQLFGYEYIRIFIRVNFLDTNIFGYSFVARF